MWVQIIVRKKSWVTRRRMKKVYAMVFLGLVLLYSFTGDVSALSVTVNDVECVYEYVLYEGDTVSGNFVVVDHDIFWSSDHPGIDFIVCILTFLLKICSILIN